MGAALTDTPPDTVAVAVAQRLALLLPLSESEGVGDSEGDGDAAGDRLALAVAQAVQDAEETGEDDTASERDAQSVGEVEAVPLPVARNDSDAQAEALCEAVEHKVVLPELVGGALLGEVVVDALVEPDVL